MNANDEDKLNKNIKQNNSLNINAECSSDKGNKIVNLENFSFSSIKNSNNSKKDNNTNEVSGNRFCKNDFKFHKYI